MKTLRPIFPLLIFILVIFLLWRALRLHPEVVPSPLINKKVPLFILPTLTKNGFKSPQGFLGEITLLNVWATWCYACAEEHSLLMKLANSPNYRMYGYIYKDTLSATKKWLNHNGNPFQKVIIDQSGKTALDWGIYGTPETFVIDKNGIIRYKLIGAITVDNWNTQLKPVIDKLREER